MARPATMLTLLLALAAGPAPAQDNVQGNATGTAPYVPTAAETAAFNAARTRLERWTRPTLTPFSSQAEIRRWLTDARAAEQAIPRDPNAGQELLLVEPRVAPRSPPPTREALTGLDEGDDVRTVGRFLLILHNGRVYSIDTGNAPGAATRLADMADPGGPDWTLYDSLLVRGDRVIVVGYTERARSILLSFLRLGPDGRLQREGVHLIGSRDEGYAVALAGDRLVVYGSTDFPYWGGSSPDFAWPTQARWDQAAGDRDEPPRRGADGEEENAADAQVRRGAVDARPLLQAADVYRPLLPTLNAELHIISVCPLGSGPVRRLSCQSTGLAAPITSNVLFGTDAAYLLATPTGDEEALLDPACPNGDGHAQGLVYRVPLAGGPTSLALEGVPRAGSARPDGTLRVFVDSVAAGGCPRRLSDTVLLTAPAAAFAATPARAGTVAPVPWFTADGLAVAGGDMIHFSADAYRSAQDEIHVMPIADPEGAVEIEVPHRVHRADPVTGGILLSGLNGEGRLVATLLRLDGQPRLGTGIALTPPIEGSGIDDYVTDYRATGWQNLIGVAVDRPGGEDRDGNRIASPDIVFLSPDPDGALRDVGRLERGPDGARLAHSGFCDPPCYGWSRHSRAIFMNGRIFGLAGGELIEGGLNGGRIVELRRFNIVAASTPAG